ncbi:hypothetical protein VIBHAR_p08259 (plasmid) [Vibrio campbellii ATCC BAA-1116]|uniref:Uncharacterized protein n=1 Tax=Vibrio campbellii (strain ATCC BAA-1116) TaxID=2902295 RepID=A7N8R9_VIBC1|nr:hypothetical protein VIBHAR_p08259 [Vibrio campbellii ATCC BAA-1116]
MLSCEIDDQDMVMVVYYFKAQKQISPEVVQSFVEYFNL